MTDYMQWIQCALFALRHFLLSSCLTYLLFSASESKWWCLLPHLTWYQPWLSFHSHFTLSTAYSFSQPPATTWVLTITHRRFYTECRLHWSQQGQLFINKADTLKLIRTCTTDENFCLVTSKHNPKVSLLQGTRPSSLHVARLETCKLFCCSSLFLLSHTHKSIYLSHMYKIQVYLNYRPSASQASGLSWLLQRKMEVSHFYHLHNSWF